MIGEMCTKPVVTISPKVSVQEAARLMRRKNVGALVMVDSSRPQGILTDRDIVTAVVAQGRDPMTTTVSEVMRRDLTVIREERRAPAPRRERGRQAHRHHRARRSAHAPGPRDGACLLRAITRARTSSAGERELAGASA